MPHNSCCSRKSGAAEFYSNSAVNQYAPNKVIEPIRHDISLQFQQLSTKCFMGKTTLTFKHNGKALVSNARDLQEIRLNAVDFEDVKVSGEGLKQYHYSGHHILLVWDTCFNKEEERKVTIEYTVENPVAGVYFDKDDDMINATAQWAVTYCETEKARYWLPTVDFPTVRTSLTYSITAPKEYISLANGSLESTEVHGEMKTTKWKLDYPW
ncbi:hypothetical protein BDF20DRAFT_129560 [Mycotypha africana]|uniref:uncharacterized protein n=1 Tax=Mycotypha africana TaxID=64632 RepID=UPI00230148BA|nr:uncharacterized protein BDF20DRAFT_129560 [Mycotypha africana]KAI8968862.1 hypothetical protein BDF20DRAFT_129560 [Mycotypha africana]